MSSMGQKTRRSTDSVPPGRGQLAKNKPGDAKSTEKWKMPPGRTWLWFVGILLANYLLVRFLVPGPEAPVTVPYTLFKEQVGKGNVEAIYSQGEPITGRFKNPVTYPPPVDKDAARNDKSEGGNEKDAAPSGAPCSCRCP